MVEVKYRAAAELTPEFLIGRQPGRLTNRQNDQTHIGWMKSLFGGGRARPSRARNVGPGTLGDREGGWTSFSETTLEGR